MALIKCTECGKEFSDKAQCCPHCACPTEQIISYNNYNDADNEIIATYDILGYDFNIDKKLDFRIKLISEFNSKKSMMETLIGQIYDKLGNIDDVIEQIPEFLSDFLEANIQGSINLLTKYDVFECDEQHFFEKYGDQLDATAIMEPIVTRYLEIQGLHDEVEEYHRQLRYAHRNSWNGGGFGIKGAIKGHLKAQMLNAGTSFLTSFSDNKIHNENLQEIRNAKIALYNNVNTKQLVVKATLTLYTNCFNCVLNEFKNFGKLKDTFFDTAKANSIVNNIWRLINQQEEYESTVLIAQIIEAFKADPTNRDVLHLIVLLEEDTWDDPHDEDIINYAREYDLLNEYIDWRIGIIAKEHNEEIIEFKNSTCTTIQSFEKYKEIEQNYFNIEDILVEECHWIKLAYICEKLELEYGLIYAILEYAKYDKTSEDNQAFISALEALIKSSTSDEYDSDFSEQAIKCFQNTIKKLKCNRVIDYNISNLTNLIEKVCFSHSNDHNCTSAFGFHFSNNDDIKRIQYYKHFKESAEIPNDAKIYMLCGKMQYSPETAAKCVLAVTNYGIYIYQIQSKKLEKIKEFFSWHNLSATKFEICADGGIYINGKLFKEYSWELLHILSDLNKKVADFLNNHEKYKKDLSTLSVEDRELTESEVHEIDHYYETSTENLGKKFYHIIKANYKSKAAKEKINEKKGELLEHIKMLREKQYYTEKKVGFGSIVGGIIWIGIGLWFFLKWGGIFKFIWKILGGFFVICGISSPFMAFNEAKKENEKLYKQAMECKNELLEIESLFIVSNDDIKIK